MSDGVDWRRAFGAFGALLGEPPEAIALALGEAAEATPGAASEPRDPASRASRARAVAAVVTRVVADLESARLR
jgi:hypothetical protein